MLYNCSWCCYKSEIACDNYLAIGLHQHDETFGWPAPISSGIPKPGLNVVSRLPSGFKRAMPERLLPLKDSETPANHNIAILLQSQTRYRPLAPLLGESIKVVSNDPSVFTRAILLRVHYHRKRTLRL